MFDAVVLQSAAKPFGAPLRKALEKFDPAVVDWERDSATDFETALRKGQHDWVLVIDQTRYDLTLKHSTSELLQLVTQSEPEAALIYGDYEIENNGSLSEIHLLDYHAGRVRSDMDLGVVWLVNRQKLEAALPLTPGVQRQWLYDLRLRLSEQGKFVHIANRFQGSLYRIHRPPGKADVFQYLLQDEATQKELEMALTAHLQRIGAYLAPGAHYQIVPYYDRTYEYLASIVIPVNHRPEFIGKAIESVWNQTIQNIEVIVVVNGGTTDPTIEVVRQYQPGGENYQPHKPPVSLIILDINNIGFSLNAGLKAAKGKFYVQLDSDDQLAPNAVEKILEVYRNDHTIGMVIGSYEVWELPDDGGPLKRREDIPAITHDEWTDENGRNNLLRVNGAGAPRSFYIDLVRDLGWLDMNTVPQARNYGEDYDLVLRMSEKYRIGRVWEPIYRVVRHKGGTDHSIDEITQERNNNAKDMMRLSAIKRRQRLNGVAHG